MGASAETSPSPRKRHALELFSGLPRAYDSMGAVLSFGQDPRWRATLVDQVNPLPGQRVLDVATGTGMVAFALARRGCEVVGLDQSPDMLSVARRHLDERPDPKPRITFVQGQAEALPFDDGEFDALTFTYLLRYVDDPAATMRELARVIKPGAKIGMVEFGVPQSNPAARGLAGAHPGRVTDPGTCLVTRLVRGRPLPRAEHRGIPRPGARPRRACGASLESATSNSET